MRITDTHVYFYSSKQCFSNWHRCSITDPKTNIVFANSEQIYMWYKADYFGDIDTRDKIANTPDPRENKELGRQVKNYIDLEWNRVRLDNMIYVNKLKFNQNESFRNELINTGKRILVEASPYDTIWGVGLSEDDYLILHEKNWKGLNLLGIALMEVRESYANYTQQR